MMVAAAGPASNLVMALAAAFVFRALGGIESVAEPAVRVLYLFVSINVSLAVFNMLPVPPLDGGNVLSGLLPDRFAPVLNGLRQYGFIILLALMVTGVLDTVVRPVSNALQRLLLL
jgi:Zn-dependent protease